MRKNNTQTKYGIHFRHNGQWTKNPSSVFTKGEILSIAGRGANKLPFTEVLTQFRLSVAEVRKQAAKLVLVS